MKDFRIVIAKLKSLAISNETMIDNFMNWPEPKRKLDGSVKIYNDLIETRHQLLDAINILKSQKQ